MGHRLDFGRRRRVLCQMRTGTKGVSSTEALHRAGMRTTPVCILHAHQETCASWVDTARTQLADLFTLCTAFQVDIVGGIFSQLACCLFRTQCICRSLALMVGHMIQSVEPSCPYKPNGKKKQHIGAWNPLKQFVTTFAIANRRGADMLDCNGYIFKMATPSTWITGNMRATHTGEFRIANCHGEKRPLRDDPQGSLHALIVSGSSLELNNKDLVIKEKERDARRLGVPLPLPTSHKGAEKGYKNAKARNVVPLHSGRSRTQGDVSRKIYPVHSGTLQIALRDFCTKSEAVKIVGPGKSPGGYTFNVAVQGQHFGSQADGFHCRELLT
eukprot:5371095-Amphidinium_carterae.1